MAFFVAENVFWGQNLQPWCTSSSVAPHVATVSIAGIMAFQKKNAAFCLQQTPESTKVHPSPAHPCCRVPKKKLHTSFGSCQMGGLFGGESGVQKNINRECLWLKQPWNLRYVKMWQPTCRLSWLVDSFVNLLGRERVVKRWVNKALDVAMVASLGYSDAFGWRHGVLDSCGWQSLFHKAGRCVDPAF